MEPPSSASRAAASPPAAPSATRRLWMTAGWAVVYLLAAGLVQFHFVSIPYDQDTAYHVAVGRLIREHGILHAFPWTPFSWLADHYADKELLFHLLFVPLAGLSWVTAAKIVGTIVGAGVLFALYLVLRAEGVWFAGIWTLLPLAASDVLVFRWALVRPHLLSMALAVVVLWAASRGRLAVLGVASALYPWCYVAWQMPLALVAVAEAARLLSRERLRWRPAAVAAGGIALGLVLHPNVGNLLRFTWIQIVDVLFRHAWGGRASLELGQELAPFSFQQWVRWLLPTVLLLGTSLVLAWRNREDTSTPFAFALAALAFGLLTVRTARFAEYFIPFSAAAMALASRFVRWRPLSAAVLGACALYTGSATAETLRGLGTKQERIPPDLTARFQQSIPPGAQVFTCDWGHTGNLMLALPDRRFVVALDPTFFYVKDPDLYDLWYRLPREAPAGSAQTIRERFGARYVICFWEDRFRRFFNRLAFEPGVKTLSISEFWNAYELEESSP